jgi:hypothetical protein
MENAGMPRGKKSRRIAPAMRLFVQCVTHQPRNWRKTAVLLATGSFFAHRPFTRTRKLLLVAKWYIYQLQFKPFPGLMIPKHQRIVCFGSRHAPF